jgi:hypothetical protein
MLTPGFHSIIFELIKGEMQYVRDLENIDIVSISAHPRIASDSRSFLIL